MYNGDFNHFGPEEAPNGQENIFAKMRMDVLKRIVNSQNVLPEFGLSCGRVLSIFVLIAIISVLIANLQYDNINLQKLVKIFSVLVWLGGFVSIFSFQSLKGNMVFAVSILNKPRRYGFESALMDILTNQSLEDENRQYALKYLQIQLRMMESFAWVTYLHFLGSMVSAGLMYLNQYFYTAIFMAICQILGLIMIINNKKYLQSVL